MVRIYYMGKAYEVPEGLTIMKALEYAGFRFIRGSGCRGGFCGACGVIYRSPGEYKLRVGLACQTTVKDGMHLAILPYSPMVKPIYRIDKLKPDLGTILKYFPEIVRCVSCNSCTKACPQDLEVMEAIQAIRQNDIARAANLIFDCIMCGLCSTRCPADIRHPYLFQLVRRLYGKHLLSRARHVELRVKEIVEGRWEAEFSKLMKMSVEELRKLYTERKIEGGEK
ncbi:MAG: 4Fe-4S ferredoxin [Thermoprotei archaeon]|nr:MAG: 4Fe-4S ferredoxin [Thermoprotei archaeon]